MEPKNEQFYPDNTTTNPQDVDEIMEEEDRLMDEISEQLLIERAEVYKALAKGVGEP
jgi:predicted transcriptional regulator